MSFAMNCNCQKFPNLRIRCLFRV